MINFPKDLFLHLLRWDGHAVVVFHSVNMVCHTEVPLLNLTALYFPIHKSSPVHKGTILNTRGLVLFFYVCLQQILESTSSLSGLQIKIWTSILWLFKGNRQKLPFLFPYSDGRCPASFIRHLTYTELNYMLVHTPFIGIWSYNSFMR